MNQRHSEEFIRIVEGFYAVEQYVPDYTAELTRLTRTSYGRSHFQIRWGSEEERHADLWRNVLLFSRRRSPEYLQDYTESLRASSWTLPFDSPIHMLLYTVIQERATQVNYINLAKVARGKSALPQFAGDFDEVLDEACTAIAVDEAAHYEFFLAGAQLYLYYFPEETLEALVDVLKNFVMPASQIVPNYRAFIEVLYEGRIFGRNVYAREVVPTALANLGIESIRAIEKGIRKTREVPDHEGSLRNTALFQEPTFDGVDFSIVEASVIRLFDRISRYESDIGLAEIDPTEFVPNTWKGFISPILHDSITADSGPEFRAPELV